MFEDHTPPIDTPKIPLIPQWPGTTKRRLQEDLSVGPCVDLCRQLRPCYGPRGLAKSLLFRFPRGSPSSPVSSPDTASVLAHMNLEDPSALTLASAATSQAKEHGDGAGAVLLLASSLLRQAWELLALGVTRPEIQTGYRLACGRALVLLEGMTCGSLEDPRDELQVVGILRPFLSSWQPGFDALLAGVMARCCVHSWRPIISGDRGEVWEGVTFDPSCVRVCTLLDKGLAVQGTETEDGEIETDRAEKGEEQIEITGQEVQWTREGQKNKKQGEEVENEATAEEIEGKEREEKRESDECLKEDDIDEEESQDQPRICQEEEAAEMQMEDKEKRNGEMEEDNKGEEAIEFEDWVDLGLEIWGASSDGERDDGVEWKEGSKERETLIEEGRRTERRERREECRDLAVRIHGSASKLRKRFATHRQIHMQITSVRSAQRRRRLHRPKGRLTRTAPLPASYHNSPKKTHHSPRKTHPSDLSQSIPLQASVVVEEPQDEKACTTVTVTLRSPDQALLDSAEGAVGASLKLYRSLLADLRVVPGAGATEVGLAMGLTQEGLGQVGMEQLAVHAFAQALLEPVKVLGENSGTPADLAVLRQYRGCWEGRMEETRGGGGGVVDGLGCKASAIERATEASLTVLTQLSVSQTAEEGDKQIYYPVSKDQPAPEYNGHTEGIHRYI